MERYIESEMETNVMDNAILEDSVNFDEVQAPKKRGRQSKRKWREIEAIQEERRLKRELDYFNDFDFELDD